VRVYDKNDAQRVQSTPIVPTLIVVDIYKDGFEFADGTPAKEYIKTYEFRDKEEFENFTFTI
jgi:hypothetical protein